MPLDSMAIACVGRELSKKLCDGRVEKIYQPERDEITLLLHTQTGNCRLLISADSANPRIHITTVPRQNPMDAPMFCMLLRKHLTGGKIVAITQPDFERILNIDIASRNELGDLTVKRLSAEFTGRNSNIILIDENGKIIDSAHHVDLTAKGARGILPGLRYMPPLPQDKTNPLTVSAEDAEALIRTMPPDTAADKVLVRLFYGVSPLAAREIVYAACGSTDAPIGENAACIASSLTAFFAQAVGDTFHPCLLRTETGKVTDFAAYAVHAYGNLLAEVPMPSMSEALEQFFEERDHHARMHRKSAALRRRVTTVLERLQKKIVIHAATMQEAEERDKFKIYGELLCANLYRIKDGQSGVTLQNYYDNTDMDIPLDKTKSVSQNAQMYFKKYRKLKTAEEMIKIELAKAQTETAYMETVLDALDRADSEAELADIRRELTEGGYVRDESRGKKQKQVAAAPLHFILEGFEIYIGKNNRQNDYVTLKLSRAEDMWLHVKNMPGSHVLIKSGGADIPETVMRQAAETAAFFSRGRDGSGVPVDYTQVKNVKKPSGAKPGMVIYDRYNTVYVTPKNAMQG